MEDNLIKYTSCLSRPLAFKKDRKTGNQCSNSNPLYRGDDRVQLHPIATNKFNRHVAPESTGATAFARLHVNNSNFSILLLFQLFITNHNARIQNVLLLLNNNKKRQSIAMLIIRIIALYLLQWCYYY